MTITVHARSHRHLARALLHACLLVLVIVVGASALAAPAAMEVDDDYGPATPGWGIDRFASIQAALDAAENGATLTITVHPGTYTENVDFAGKALTLRSEDPEDPDVVAATIIDGDQDGSVVTFDSAETNASVLSGFTIRNGRALYGGGIYCYAASPTITHNTITDNRARFTTEGGQGAGIYCEESASPVIASNTITENIADLWGGGICLRHSSGTVTGNAIFGNQAQGGYGGGVFLTQQSHPLIDANAINANLAGTDGGGLWSGGGSSPTVTGNTIRDNTTVSGSGAGICLNGGTATLSGNTITENTTGAYGGGIYVTGGSAPQITGNTITANTMPPSGQSGGGIACDDASEPIISGNTIGGNGACNYGGGIYCLDARPSIIGNVIAGNAVWGYGGGIMCMGDAADATIDGNTIHGNQAGISGGGIYVADTALATVVNCILWGHQPDDLVGATATYSCIQDGNAGTGNISSDPRFAQAGYVDPGTGDWIAGDYHLLSVRGRWNPAADGGAGAWVLDGAHSPCIDAGDPASPYASEPSPNGGRRNMGAYGNTAEASKSNVNNAPETPADPTPADGATDQARNVDLSWAQCEDPDGDPVGYDVYFGKDALPVAPVVFAQAATTYDPGLLDPHAIYHWRIVARDAFGGIAPGPIWSFQTANAAPQTPSGPIPADGAADQRHDVVLDWAPCADADSDPVTYDVYFGKDALPGSPTVTGQVGTGHDPGLLEPDTTYHWRVVARDPYGGEAPGPEWTFTTKPNTAPSAPSAGVPLNGATDQLLNVDLAWNVCIDDDGDPVTYDIYFGMDALPGSPSATGLPNAAFDPGALVSFSTYHWKVVARDPFGGEGEGPEWTFTTGDNSAPEAPSSPSPADGASAVAVDTDLDWAASADPDGDPVTYDVYFGKDALPPTATATGLPTPACDLPHLQPNADYRWRVLARDSHGAQTFGPEWSFTTGNDEAAPTVNITYPTAADGTLTEDMVTVTGTADDSSAIDSIWVNGVMATPLSANYATWQARITLSQGWDEDDPNAANTIVAAAADEHGNFAGVADTEDVVCVGECGPMLEGSLSLQCQGVLVPGDADSFCFEAVAGTALKLSLKGAKDGPPCTVRIYDPWGQALLQQTGASLSLSPVLPDSGLYVVRLLPGGPGSARYKLKLQGKPPKVKLKVDGALASGLDDDEEAFGAARGSLVAVSVSSKLFDPRLELLDPMGHPISLTGYLRARSGKLTVKNLPLPDTNRPYQTGNYVARVSSADGNWGEYRLTCSVKAPKPARLKVQHALLLGHSAKSGVAPGAPLQLKVAGAGLGVAGNTVYLGGRALTPSDSSLKGGKGSLYVNVPADLPVGPTTIYFIADGEKSNALDLSIVP